MNRPSQRCPWCGELYPLLGSTVLVAGKTWHTSCRLAYQQRVDRTGGDS